MRLAIPRGVHPACAIKNRRLKQDGAGIGLFVGFNIVYIGIPVFFVTFKTGVGSRVKKEHVDRCIFFRVGYCWQRCSISGIDFIGVRRPVFKFGIIWSRGNTISIELTFGAYRTRRKAH